MSSQLQISSSPSSSSAVVLSDPAIDMDYVPGPGPGLSISNNPLALPPKRSTSPPPPPYSVLLSPPLESPNVNGGYYPSLPLNSTSDDGSSSFTSTFLRGILASMDSTDPVVANAWLETLLDALDLLPAEAVRREVVPVAVAKGQLGRPAEVRRAAGRLLAKVTTRLDAVTVSEINICCCCCY